VLNLADPNLVAAFRRLHRNLARLDDVLWRACDVVGPAKDATGEIVEELTSASETARQGRPARSPDLTVMRAEAEAGVASLKINRHADGSAEVSVNGRRPFTLRPQLAALLAVIAAPSGDGQLVPWRSKSEVAAALGTTTGQVVSPSYVPKVVHRLREAFRRRGENWFLIKSRRGTREYRFAVGVDPK